MILAKYCFLSLCLGSENAGIGQKEQGCASAVVDPNAVNCFEQGLKGRMKEMSTRGSSLHPVVGFEKHS